MEETQDIVINEVSIFIRAFLTFDSGAEVRKMGKDWRVNDPAIHDRTFPVSSQSFRDWRRDTFTGEDFWILSTHSPFQKLDHPWHKFLGQRRSKSYSYRQSGCCSV